MLLIIHHPIVTAVTTVEPRV